MFNKYCIFLDRGTSTYAINQRDSTISQHELSELLTNSVPWPDGTDRHAARDGRRPVIPRGTIHIALAHPEICGGRGTITHLPPPNCVQTSRRLGVIVAKRSDVTALTRNEDNSLRNTTEVNANMYLKYFEMELEFFCKYGRTIRRQCWTYFRFSFFL